MDSARSDTADPKHDGRMRALIVSGALMVMGIVLFVVLLGTVPA